MGLQNKLAYYMRTAARYLEDPQQIRMRRPYFLPPMYAALSQPWAQNLSVRTILDIGANVGNFAFTVRPLFPQATIYSFEPLPAAFRDLQQNLAGAHRFQAFNLGLGESDCRLTIHQSQHAPSSSFLTMDGLHQQAFPSSATVVEEIEVQVARLDSLADRLVIEEPLLAKIDVQGYELHVLRGGEQILRRANAIIVETSFRPLYEHGPLFADVFQHLVGLGYTYQGSLDTLTDPRDGSPLQEDSLFLRTVSGSAS